jgi:hypothetical protein
VCCLIHPIQKKVVDSTILINKGFYLYNHKPTTARLQTAKDYIVFSSSAGMRMQSVLASVGDLIQTYDYKGINLIMCMYHTS